jgi:hypothetical protein
MTSKARTAKTQKPVKKRVSKPKVKQMELEWNGLYLETKGERRTMATVGGTDKGWIAFCLGDQQKLDPATVKTETQAKHAAWAFFQEKLLELNAAKEPSKLDLSADRETFEKLGSRRYGC